VPWAHGVLFLRAPAPIPQRVLRAEFSRVMSDRHIAAVRRAWSSAGDVSCFELRQGSGPWCAHVGGLGPGEGQWGAGHTAGPWRRHHGRARSSPPPQWGTREVGEGGGTRRFRTRRRVWGARAVVRYRNGPSPGRARAWVQQRGAQEGSPRSRACRRSPNPAPTCEWSAPATTQEENKGNVTAEGGGGGRMGGGGNTRSQCAEVVPSGLAFRASLLENLTAEFGVHRQAEQLQRSSAECH
jgi:hypothetical protein